MKPITPSSLVGSVLSQSNYVASSTASDIKRKETTAKEDSRRIEGTLDSGLRSIVDRKTEDAQKSVEISFEEYLDLFKKNPKIAQYNRFNLIGFYSEPNILLEDLITEL
ncbi:MAG: hypothetical protein NZO16_06595 [Deltaproteobacteria bacterium]|nr:hypothetical protein [Deltaproteobacteria bacterium]